MFSIECFCFENNAFSLQDFLIDQAIPGDWLYHSSLLTDQDPIEIIKNCIWEKFLDNLHNDIPYNLGLVSITFIGEAGCSVGDVMPVCWVVVFVIPVYIVNTRSTC